MAESHRYSRAGRRVLSALSPTWAWADRRKSSLDKKKKTAFIRAMNARYLLVASALTALFWISSCNDISELQVPLLRWTPLSVTALVAQCLLGWYLMSRCTEVFWAFYQDASDKLSPEKQTGSSLAWNERVRLALNSYLELILNFAMLYAMLPACSWQAGYKIVRFTDALSYSATTITTSGGGGFAASHWLLQALTAYEIACGLILLVVCFTIYVGHALAEFEPGWNREPSNKDGGESP